MKEIVVVGVEDEGGRDCDRGGGNGRDNRGSGVGVLEEFSTPGQAE